MFSELASRDYILIFFAVSIPVFLFLLIFIRKEKILPTRVGLYELSKEGVFITTIIFLSIIAFCISIFVYRINNINYFIKNGIQTVANIQEVERKKKKVIFSYSYQYKENIYFGKTSTKKRKEFYLFIPKTEILVIVNPKDPNNSLFYKIVEAQARSVN